MNLELFSSGRDANMNNGICININHAPIFDNNVFIFLSFKLFQAKYSNNCMEIKARKYKKSKTPMTLLKSANEIPNKLNKNVFRDTFEFQHIYITITYLC